ncbi:ComEA family DNA-binding protein, partial [Campylobacter blaseri]
MKKLLLTLLLSFTFLFSTININTASKEELMSIKGVGEKTAEYIIDYRKDKKFEKIEDIK